MMMKEKKSLESSGDAVNIRMSSHKIDSVWGRRCRVD